MFSVNKEETVIQTTYLWLCFCIYMFITPHATKKKFTTRKLFTQADIQGHFRVIHMETYGFNLLILKEDYYH